MTTTRHLEQCKALRDSVKKDLTKTLQPVYFSASSEEWLDGIRAMKTIMDGLVTLTLDFAQAFSKAKREKGWIDFSDLEHLCLKILLSPEQRRITPCVRRQPKN